MIRSDTGPLTEREQQIVELLDKGATPRQVADRLGIALNTVYRYQYTIRQKRDYETKARA